MGQKVEFRDVVALLKELISLPSFSGEESETADALCRFLTRYGVRYNRIYNNVWALSRGFDATKPTLLLNSHHDTVRPSKGHTRSPFEPCESEGRLYGLGANDAGASLVSLVATFIEHIDTSALPFNLLLGLTAAEENMGREGMSAFLAEMQQQGIAIDMAIVGEPTSMQAATAERGLVVLDGLVKGQSGHAARNEGDNAIYKAIEDVERLRSYRFPQTSEQLGDVKVTVTQIDAGTQHNVIPGECRFVVDVRTTDTYSNEEVVEYLQQAVKYATLTPRSVRIRASAISHSHPLVESAVAVGCQTFVSPTVSDRALMGGIAALKIGVGESARSHTADEYVCLTEIEAGLKIYGGLLAALAERLK